MEERLSMGRSFNSHFGYVDLPSDILEVGIFDDHLEFYCSDGIYKATKDEDSNKITLIKIHGPWVNVTQPEN